MKKILLLLGLALMAFSCQTEPVFDEDITADRIISDDGEVGDGNNNNGEAAELYSDDLLAGQTIDSGNLTVELDEGTVIVSYETEGDWVITETHLYVGPLADMPLNTPGNPQIGQFPDADEFDPAVTAVTYATLDLEPGECVYVAAHAVVVNTVTGEEETAWANGDPLGGSSWAMAFEICAPAE